MDDLVTWLRAQLDEDERVINAACLHIDDCSDSGFTDRFTDDRLLAEVDAERRILDRLRDERGFYRDDIASGTAEPVIRLLAVPYADRTGYREEWRP